MRQPPDEVQAERNEWGRVAQEARDRFGHDAALAGAGAALDQHLQVQLLRRQPLQGVAADVAEAPFVDIVQQALLQVLVAEPAGVVVAQHALDVGRRQHLADDVEDGIVVERVANLLQLVEQALEDAPLDGVGGDEVEDQAVLLLPVAVDAPHALLEAVGVPGDVVVEEDVADLQVDPLAGRLGRREYLHRALAELLLGVKPRARLVPRTRLHAAVDDRHLETPRVEFLDEVVERVPELGEEDQPLVRPVEESLAPQEFFELGELGLDARAFDVLGPDGQGAELGDLLAHPVRVAGQGDRIEQPFQPLAVAILHLLQLVEVRRDRRSGLREVLRLREGTFQPVGPVGEAAPHGPGAGGEAPLVERHQEADGAGARIVAGRGRPRALALHEPRHLAVQLELGAVDGEVHRGRNALREYPAGGPLPVVAPLREMDHRLLRAPQVERGAAGVHRFPDRAHVGVCVAVEELQEEREVVGVALVGRGGQQQHVVRRVAQQLAQLVALALVRLVARRHAVGLVHDDKVPVRLPQARQHVVPLRQVQRRDHPRVLHPLVDAELLAQVAPLQDLERLVELLLQLALPLEREVRRDHDQDALGEAPQPQLADQQPGHDRLPGPGVVGQQEAHARQLQQVVVDRLQLVRQRVDARDRQAEAGIEFPGNPECVGLEPQPHQRAVPVVAEAAVEHGQPGQVVGAERHLAEALGARADQAERPVGRSRCGGGLHAHRLVEQRAGEDLACARRRWGRHSRIPRVKPPYCTLAFSSLPGRRLPPAIGDWPARRRQPGRRASRRCGASQHEGVHLAVGRRRQRSRCARRRRACPAPRRGLGSGRPQWPGGRRDRRWRSPSSCVTAGSTCWTCAGGGASGR